MLLQKSILATEIEATFCFRVILLAAHIKHILVCTAIDIRTAPGDHLSDCIGFASWKERKALFAQGNNPIKSERGQQLWRQNWNNNFFLKAKRFFFSKLISICVLSILTYDRPLLGAASTLRPKWKATALQLLSVLRIMNPFSCSATIFKNDLYLESFSFQSVCHLIEREVKSSFLEPVCQFD